MRRHRFKVHQIRNVIGVSQTTFAGWRTGRWHPSRHNLEKIFKLFPSKLDATTLANAYCQDKVPEPAKSLIQISSKEESEREEPSDDFAEAVVWLREILSRAEGDQAESARRTIIAMTRLFKKTGF
jgi:hypothetical protein